MALTLEEKATLNTMVEQALNKPRTVELQLTNDDLLFFARKMADRQANLKGDPLLAAIGYLTAWGLGSYESVLIYKYRDDITAFYSNKGDTRRFVMGAIWRPELGKFSFHS